MRAHAHTPHPRTASACVHNMPTPPPASPQVLWQHQVHAHPQLPVPGGGRGHAAVQQAAGGLVSCGVGLAVLVRVPWALSVVLALLAPRAPHPRTRRAHSNPCHAGAPSLERAAARAAHAPGHLGTPPPTDTPCRTSHRHAAAHATRTHTHKHTHTHAGAPSTSCSTSCARTWAQTTRRSTASWSKRTRRATGA
jgi:hypothetical protein